MPEEKSYLALIRRGVEKTLPSGLVVRLRPVDAGMMLADEKSTLPDNLMRVVQAQLAGIQSGKDEKEVRQELIADVEDSSPQRILDFYRDMRLYGMAVAKFAVIYPHIVDAPNPDSDDEISLNEFPTDDLIAMGRIVGMPLHELESFRFEQGESVEPVSDSENDVPDAEPGSRPDDVAAPSDAGDLEGDALDGDISVRQRRKHVRDGV